jgi:two-component system chemotaxis response regulator CheB
MPQHPLPVVMVSSLTRKGGQITLDALDAGAIDFVTKPTSNLAQSLGTMIKSLREKIKIASHANVGHWKKDRKTMQTTAITEQKSHLLGSTDKVIAIGASTGGTEAIKAILTHFPATMPGVVVVQHMPAGFTRMFAERLNQLCAMEVKEAENGDRIRSGRVLVAPGGKHLKVVRSGGVYQAICQEGPKVSGHCPSVDVMMESMAKEVGPNAVGIMLTGMGADGAAGMLKMRRAGARNLAQNEESCVVFGMPKVAFEKGGAEKLIPLHKMLDETINLLKEMSQ